MKKLIMLICFFQITYPCGVDIVAVLLRQVGITKKDNLELLNKYKRTECASQDDKKDEPEKISEEEQVQLINQKIAEIVADYCKDPSKTDSNGVWDQVTALYHARGSNLSEEKRVEVFSMMQVEQQIEEKQR